MDNSSAIWMSLMSQLEMDDQRLNLIQQYQMNHDALYEESSFDGFAANDSFCNSESYPAYPSDLITEINGSTTHNSFPSSVMESTKGLKPSTGSATATATTPILSSSRTSSNIICFANPKEEHANDSLEFSEGAVLRGSCSSRSPLQAQDHVLNERKRRERMAKQFVALSAIIPNNKKMDKASILGEAMKYIKELQERVKELEKEEHRKDVESFVSVKRARFSGDEDVSSSEENSPTGHFHFTPEIEVRVSGANVLLKIHCHKRSGLLLKALEEIQKYRLSIVSSNAMPFANSTLLIDIIAQMEDDVLMIANELAKKLELAILNFM